MYTEEEAEEARQDSVDLLEEGRLLALSRSSIYQQSLCRYHNRKVSDLILSGIKPRLVEPLKRSAGCWVEELPAVL